MPDSPSQPDRQFAIDVVRRLREANYEAYWAGGCVRDQLLGRTPKDYDVATSAMPEQIRELFGYRRTLAIGAAFGVITVLGPKQASPIEVATFRQDADYSDGRHPDAVKFSSPEEDAQRRDFTINGLFFDPLSEQVIDFVGGEADLRAGVVRAIGDPHQRIAEDKLRMLRAVRFTATFGFQLDPQTLAAIGQHSAEIIVVSVERISAELRRMLAHANRATALRLLLDSGLLSVVFPELAALASDADLTSDDASQSAWQRLLQVEAMLATEDFALALAGLLYGVAAQQGFDESGMREIGLRWKLTNEEIRRSLWLARQAPQILVAQQLAWPKLQRLLIEPDGPLLVDLAEAIAKVSAGDLVAIKHCRAKLALPPEQLNPDPLLTGDDLLRLGIPRGRIYGTLLEAVRDAQLEGRLDSTEAASVWAQENWQTLSES